MNYPKPDILEKKDIQVQARYFFVPEYTGAIPQDFFPGSKQYASHGRPLRPIFDDINIDFDTFDDAEIFVDDDPELDFGWLDDLRARQSIGRVNRIQDFPPADNDTIVLQIENSSSLRQPVELFNAVDNALAANWGNRSGITITSVGGLKTYAEIMNQATNTQFWIGMVRTEVISGADPRDFFSSPIRFKETDPAGNSNTSPLFQRPTHDQLHREVIDTNVRGVRINPFTGMEIEMPPFTTIVLTIFKEPNPDQSPQFAQPSRAIPRAVQLSPDAIRALRHEGESFFAQPSFQVLGIDEAADMSLTARLKEKAAERREARKLNRAEKKSAKQDARAAKVEAKHAIRARNENMPSRNPYNFDADGQ